MALLTEMSEEVKPVTDSLKVTVTGMGDAVVGFGAAELMVTVGRSASTLKVALGPAVPAMFPALSVAVPAAIEMPSVPVPVRLLSVTVRVLPEPETPTVALAVPVLFSVMLPAKRVIASRLASL